MLLAPRYSNLVSRPSGDGDARCAVALFACLIYRRIWSRLKQTVSEQLNVGAALEQLPNNDLRDGG